MRVLLIEDDKSMAQNINMLLTKEGMVVDVSNLGEDGCEYAELYDYDIIILDLMLPDMDGIEVLKKFRLEKIATPVLILSGLTAPDKKVQGFMNGADDYLTKPFDRSELIARIKTVTRRQGEVITDKISFADLSLNNSSKELVNTLNQKSIHLNYKEAEILSFLMRRPKTILAKEDIITRVWGFDSDASDNNLEAYISFIRRKLNFLESKCEITAIKKVGYMFGEKK